MTFGRTIALSQVTVLCLTATRSASWTPPSPDRPSFHGLLHIRDNRVTRGRCRRSSSGGRLGVVDSNVACSF